MKTTSKKIRSIMAFCAMLILPFGAYAVPDIYVCGAGTVTLAYTGTYTLVSGDKVVWQKVTAAGVPVSGSAAQVVPYDGTPGSGNLVVTGGTDLPVAGDHYWVAHVVTADPATCTGDVSALIDIYMLPAFTVAVTPATASYCAEGTTNLTKTIVTTAATPASTLPAGVNFVYDWSSTPTGAGSVDAGDPKKFNMTTTTLGSYVVTSSVKYSTTVAGKPLKSPGGNACVETGTTTITVAPKPGTPTITVS